MDKVFENRYRKAISKARQADKIEPRAARAKYDQKKDRIVVELTNGTTFIFPPSLTEGLAGAPATILKNLKITPSGDALRWEELDVDLSLTGLLMGIFGGNHWMSELGRKGGMATSTVKVAASRKNGQKGGRPKRIVV